jgi:hypothetical protein
VEDITAAAAKVDVPAACQVARGVASHGEETHGSHAA